jgi:HAD superfamily hydrolase (TIGR01509 family)
MRRRGRAVLETTGDWRERAHSFPFAGCEPHRGQDYDRPIPPATPRKDGEMPQNTRTDGTDRIEAVVFDIGETLVDETRAWSLEAKRAGVTCLTLFACLGGLIDRGEDHRGVWEFLDAQPPSATTLIEATDLYPDAEPCLHAVRAAGLRVGIAGNQPEATEDVLRQLGLPLDLVASSARWGVEKPDLRFFRLISEELGIEPGRIAYVGDRLDNDVLPAKAIGMRAVFIRRGPWGHLHSRRPEVAAADLRIDDLGSLVPALLEP